jgi:hypothetical protein
MILVITTMTLTKEYGGDDDGEGECGDKKKSSVGEAKIIGTTMNDFPGKCHHALDSGNPAPLCFYHAYNPSSLQLVAMTM